jgi:single-stranded DNA-binding protein
MITVTGNLADDPHTFRTSDGRAGCDLRLAVDLPPRGATGGSQVRYVKAVAFGVLAIHAAESVRKGDRVTIQGRDPTAEAWVRWPSPGRPSACGGVAL